MKKKTKKRLNRLERQVRQLAQDIQTLKGPPQTKDIVESAGAPGKSTSAKKNAKNRGRTSKKAMVAQTVVVPNKLKSSPTKATVDKSVIPRRAKQNVRTTAQRPTKTKSQPRAASKSAPKSTLKMFQSAASKAKPSVAPAAVVSGPQVVTQLDKGSEIPS